MIHYSFRRGRPTLFLVIFFLTVDKTIAQWIEQKDSQKTSHGFDKPQ